MNTMNKTILFLLAFSILAACAAPSADETALLDDDVAPAQEALDEPEPVRELRRGEVACNLSGPAVARLGEWDATYDLAAERTGDCRGRLGFSRGSVLAEVIDPEPRMYGAAMGARLLDGTQVLCANVVDGWSTGDTLANGRTVFRVAAAEIWCAANTGSGWSELTPVVEGHADATWLQEVGIEDGQLRVGFLRDSRFAYQDFNGQGRPPTDGACHADLAFDTTGALVAAAVVHDEGYPWGPGQAIDE